MNLVNIKNVEVLISHEMSNIQDNEKVKIFRNFDYTIKNLIGHADVVLRNDKLFATGEISKEAKSLLDSKKFKLGASGMYDPSKDQTEIISISVTAV